MPSKLPLTSGPWQVAKNAFRTSVVVLTCVVAVSVGQSDAFDRFVALIGQLRHRVPHMLRGTLRQAALLLLPHPPLAGALGSVPLGLILPPALALKILGTTGTRRSAAVWGRMATVVVGVAAMGLCLVTTIATW